MSSSLAAHDYEAAAAHNNLNDFTTLPLQQWPAQWHPTKPFPTPQSMADTPFQQETRIAFSNEEAAYHLGDPELPTAPYRDHIVATIAANQTSVISSETGSGKSSQVPLYLLEAGAPRIFVTQPRILAARELMERARHSLGEDRAQLAGYLTGNAEDSDCPEGARVIYVTDQLLFKMANRGLLNPDDTIMIDEAHERTAATVILMGLIKELLPENPQMRAVVSSATIDTNKFGAYLGSSNELAPVLILPGRTHPVQRHETTDSVAEIMRSHMEEGRNVLAMEPGLARLKSTATQAFIKGKGHVVHQLYGDQSPRQQKAALSPEDGNHVVGTKVVETSITPLNKDVVADSGLSNIGGNRMGVRWLATTTSSQAAILQRLGRVGRTKPGEHWLSLQPDDAPPQPSFEDRPAYDPPAMEISSLTSFVAELLIAGRRIDDLDLIERPTQRNLEHDYKVLHRLGAVALENGALELTEDGRAMTQLPLDAPLSRMLVEAGKTADNPDVNTDALQLQVAAAVAIQQVNGILNMRQGSQRRYVHRKSYQDALSTEQTSDILFGLDVFTAMMALEQKILSDGKPDPVDRFERILEQNDVLLNRYYKAVRTYKELCGRLDLESGDIKKADKANRQQIIACQIAGAEEVFAQRSKQMHWGIRGEHRTLGRRTTINAALAQLIVGIPFDLHGLSAKGTFQRKFISGGSVVTVEQLLQHAAHRITHKTTGFGVNPKGQMVERKALYFDIDMQFADVEASLPPTLDSRVAVITALMRGVAPSLRDPEQPTPYRPAGTVRAASAVSQWKNAQKLQEKSNVDLKVAERYQKLIAKAVRESIDQVPLSITDPVALDAFIPTVYLNALVRPTRKRDIPAIIERAPDGIKVRAEDDSSIYLPVFYRRNIGHVTIPRNMRLSVRREDFEAIETNHGVKVRVGNGKYLPIDAVFKVLDEEREAQASKYERRAEHRLASARKDPSIPTRRERRQEIDEEIDVRVKAQIKLLDKKPQKGRTNAARNSARRDRQEKLQTKERARAMYS